MNAFGSGCKPALARALQRSWYRNDGGWPVLKPLAGAYGAANRWRRRAYRRGWLRCARLPVPVLVVGNITVGGSGKTPVVLALIERLAARGRRVGVVARGYGGRAPHYPLAVTRRTSAAAAGDEPVLIAARSAAAVAVDPDRGRAARWLIQHAGVDCIVADDGLQHYALARDIEIAVVDARRGCGNGHLLPAGPLREPISRLECVDLVLTHGGRYDFWLAPRAAVSLDGARRRALAEFTRAPVHAIAGIGDPARFFDMLGDHGVQVEPHPKPDHHVYHAADLAFGDDAPVLMTEKDAVKCAALLDPETRARCWAVPVTTVFAPAAETQIGILLERFCRLPTPTGNGAP